MPVIDSDGNGNGSSAPAADHAKSYALHAAAELLEQSAARQRSLEPNLLDDWLDHIERFFHASLPKKLIETWKTHRIDVFAHLAWERVPPSLIPKLEAAAPNFRPPPCGRPTADVEPGVLSTGMYGAGQHRQRARQR